MERLLTFQQTGLDVALLDEIVSCLKAAKSPAELAHAQAILTQFQDHPDAWTTVDRVLETSHVIETKYYALQVLEKAIKFRWKILPEVQREGIKNFLVNLVIRLSQEPGFVAPSDPTARRMNRLYLNKLDLALVQLVKQEWPGRWQNFIPEIVNASRTGEALCENNMVILRLLSEEVFDFSSGQMTQAKIVELKQAYNSDFALIFQLCDYVLQASTSETLLSTTLETLLRFLNWIPLGYIFETSLIETIVLKFFATTQFRLASLKCLVEMGSMKIDEQKLIAYQPKVIDMYKFMIEKFRLHFPLGMDLGAMWRHGQGDAQDFIQTAALFLGGTVKTHLLAIERLAPSELVEGLDILVRIAQIGDWELLKICVDFWTVFTSDLYQSECRPDQPASLTAGAWGSGLMGMGPGMSMGMGMMETLMKPASPRMALFGRLLTDMRRVIIENMAKPEEVLIVEDDNGEIVRESLKDSDVITMYKTMRETLVYLTHLDYDDTETIMLDKLCRQVDGTEWSWNKLNTLCWAIGSISGTTTEEKEKHFLVTVIKDLLTLCERKRGKDNKAVVASNIMYVVGQYPRFLRAHWKFLKTVVNKLFEFMHETHPGVQDMACDTFLKITEKCRRKFVVVQTGETQPFIDELLVDPGVTYHPAAPPQPPFTLRQVISKLEKHQRHTVYEAVAMMISSLSPDAEAQRKELLIGKLMAIPNADWSVIIRAAHSNAESICDSDTIQTIDDILRINNRVAFALGPAYRSQLLWLFETMLNVYKVHSEMISLAIMRDGVIAAQHSNVRAMRTAKRDAMRLIDTFVNTTDDPTFIAQFVVPPMLGPVLADYSKCVPEARNPEVLLVFGSIAAKTKGVLTDMGNIFVSLFECTLTMITRNLEDYPDHRSYFFQLILSMTEHYFPILLQLNEAHFKLLVDSICWALKHADRVNAELGLNILETFLRNIEADPAVATACYQRFFVPIMQEVFYVLTDTFHKADFKQQTQILRHMFGLIHMNILAAPIFDTALHGGVSSNREFLTQYVTALVSRTFPNLHRSQVDAFVAGLFNFSGDEGTFRNHLRDFLVQLKEFSAQDNNELFVDDSQARLNEQRRLAVPGMVAGAHDQSNGMAD